jgi:hypothetical protein
MSDKLSAIIAAFNEGANKGFWRFQWRDRYGRWVEMGRGVLGKLRLKDGSIVDVRGVFVGGTENPGFGRVLVEGQGKKGIPDGIYHFASGNGEEFDALIPEEALQRLGIDPNKKDIFGNSVGERLDKDIQDLDKIVRQDITPEDRKLATEVPDDNQKKIIDEERVKSPIAKLPAGTESRDPDALDKILGRRFVDKIDPNAYFMPGQRKYGGTWDNNDYWVNPDGTQVIASKEDSKKFEAYQKPDGTEKTKSEMMRDLVNQGSKKKPAEEKDYSKLSGPELDQIINELGTPLEKSSKALDEAKRRAKLRGEKYSEFTGSPEPTDDLEKAMEQGFKATGPFGFNGYRSRNPEENKEIYDRVGKNGYYTKLSKNDDGTWTLDSRDEFGKNKESNVFDSIEDALARAKDIDNKPFEIPEERADEPHLKAIKEAFDKARSGKAPSIDDVIDRAKGNKDDDGFGDVDWFDDEESDEPKKPEVKKPEPKKPAKKKEPKEKDITPPSEEPVSEEPTEKEIKKAAKVVMKMTPEQLDALGTPEEYIEDFGGFTPSDEQTRALNALVKANARTVIDALAGSGKTTTLIAACNALNRISPDSRILILAFNTKNADDAKRKAPKTNTDAKTTHSLATAILTPNQRKAQNAKSGGVAASEKDIAALLQLDDTPMGGYNLSPEDTAHVLGKAISKFCNTADDKLTKDHILSVVEAEGDNPIPDASIDKLLGLANKYWENITSDDKIEYNENTKKYTKKRIYLSHDHYLKMWALSKPDLSKLMVNGKPVTHIFFDEAQDTNPTVAKVMKDNRDNVIISYVGDPNQSIYGFRGAENALDNAKVDADAVVDLTKTRRFSDNLTKFGNAFLNLIGAKRRIKGVGTGGQEMDIEDMPDGPNKALLTRTNYGGLEAIMAYQEEGKTVGALSVFHDDIRRAIYHLKWLGTDFKERTKSPQDENGSDAYSPDFIGIRTFKDLIARADRDPKSKAARWMELLRNSADGDIGVLEEVFKKLVIDRSDATEADEKLDPSMGSSGIIWSTPNGDMTYEIDDTGLMKIKMPSKVGFTSINGVLVKDIIKNAGLRWYGVKSGQDDSWRVQLLDENDRAEILDGIASKIPNRIQKDPRTPDVVVTTAHRAKGLEWDYVGIHNDFPQPKTDLKTGEMTYPSGEELKLAYVALTRAKKGLGYGGLAWGRDFEGPEGAAAADALNKLDPKLSKEAWDYHSKQMADDKKPGSTPEDPDDIAKALGCTGFNGDVHFYDEDDADNFPETTSTSESAPPSRAPKFLDDWTPNSNSKRKRWSKNVDGFRWELTQNADGSVTVRPRTDANLGTKKFKNLQEAVKNFKQLVAQGTQSNRDRLKKVLEPFDKDGIIRKAVDDGKSADDINDMIVSNQDWIDAVDDKKVNFLSLKAALSRVGNGDTKINKPATRKPAVVKPKKATKPQATTTTPATTKRPLQPQAITNEPDLYSAVDPKYRDTGAEIGRSTVSPAQMQELFKDATPGAVNKGLIFYGGKVDKDGSIVLHRKEYTEQAGPSKGKKRILEIRSKEAKDNSHTISVLVTDPETGVTKEYYHYKKHQSLMSIIGNPDQEKSVGVERLLNQWFDRDLVENPYPDAEYEARYGGIDGAVKKMRAGSFKNILNDRSKDDSSLKLRTPEEHAALALNGRNQILNKSLQQWWRQMRLERGSIFEALEKGDKDATVALFRTYMNSLPDTPKAKSIAKKFIADSIKQKFPGLDQRELKSILDNIDQQVASELPKTGSPATAWLSRNGRRVEQGDMVRWTNNEGRTVIGRVRDRLKVENPNGGKFNYGDFVNVEFDGFEEGVKLNTKNMDVVSPDEEMTKFDGWVKKADLKIARAERAGFTIDHTNGNVIDKDNQVVDNIFDGDDEDDLDELDEADLDTLEPKSASDVEVGDVIYDEDGQRLGKVAEVRKGRKDGKEVRGFVFDDGTKKLFQGDDEVNTAPAKRAPASSSSSVQRPKTQRSALGDRAMKAGLGVDSTTGKAAKTLALRPDDNTIEENNTKIKGDSKKTALKPTDEARAAKDEAVAIGKEVWEQSVEPKILDKLKGKGYNVSTLGEFDELYKAAQDDADAKANVHDKAKKEISKYLDTKIKSMTDADLAATQVEMTAAKLIKSNGDRDVDALEKRLRSAGFNGLATDISVVPTKSKPANKAREDKLFALGFKMLNSKNAAQINKIEELYKARDTSNKDRIAANKRVSEFASSLGSAESSATMEAMKEQGVEFDNVSFRDFEDRLISTEAGLPLEPGNTFLSSRALQEAFEFTPRSMILALVKHLKDTNQTLKVRAGVRRGEFRTVAGGYELDLSSIRNPLPGQSKVTDTAGHELKHFVQKVVPNVRALEHAWTYDRIVQNAGTPDETMPNIISLPGKKSELTFAAPGVGESYTLKQYSRKNKGIFLNPHDNSSEVLSTIVQDLFTSPGMVSRGKGATVVSKVPGGPKKTYKNAFYDEASGEWYTDASKSSKIENVVGSYGRTRESGQDKNIKHFGIGLLMMMNDWSPTEGFGPGNGVVEPPKTKKKK